jgi:hypothetical protein
MEETGQSMAKSLDKPTEAMHTFTAAQLDAQKQIRELTQNLADFGKSQFEINANKAQRSGASKEQVGQIKTLGAQLEGKQLAQSLETPFEKFEREMKKLNSLKSAGGIDAQTYARAKVKLTTDLQTAIPQVKASAGGAMTAGSAELRSALLSYRGAQRSANPQVQMQRIADQQLDQQRLMNVYLRQLTQANPQVAAYSGI